MSEDVNGMKEQLTFEEIKQIIDLIRETENISDFTLKCGDVEISLSRGGNRKASPADKAAAGEARSSRQAAPRPSASPQIASAAETQVRPDIEPGEGEVVIKSPMVGTFYRCPKPGDPPFVEVGRTVSEDTVLCIIEVMKLMNSIEAKVQGTVTRILVEDAQPVGHGQPLMIIKLKEG